MENNKHILITIDVEDWFQVENFKPWIPFSTWGQRELRVEMNVQRLLDLFDSIKLIHTKNKTQNTNEPKVRCTFFILGWLAERLPNLVREIHNRGHEVASHGYYHNLPTRQSNENLKKDLKDSKKMLEDLIGNPVVGYRAPSFDINDDLLTTIEACGYIYDSSYNSFALHGRYGHMDFSKNVRKGIAIQISKINNSKSNTLYEIPISNVESGSRILPWGGGGYFRLLPFSIFKKGVEFILKKYGAYTFYMHPWEIDPEQPKVDDASSLYKFRHYVNLNKTKSKLEAFFNTFRNNNFTTSRKYLEQTIHAF